MSSETNAPAILLNAADDVAVARRRIAAGETTGVSGIVARQLIPRGHKVALRELPVGTELRKFGQVIGVATQAIQPGEHVHLHNLAMAESHMEHQFSTEVEERGMVDASERRTF
ncbi:MAG: UxaA family hydrolase, partial [Rhizobiaceae bacterium]|nr:UxaA family hydrolase [Rhizobiaceae bacterium]